MFAPKSLTALLFTMICLPVCAAEPPASAPVANRPGAGLIFYAKAEYALNTEAINNPYITGALFQIIWSEVEKEKGKYDWSAVDQWIEPWIKAGKFVAMRTMWSTSGYWRFDYYKHPTPQWVWKEGAKFAFHEPSGTEIPLIWDPIYKKYAAEFMKEVDRKYGSNPHILFIDATPGAETNPYRFGTIRRNNPEFGDYFIKLPASDGRTYSEQMWMETVKEWIDLTDACYASDVPLLVTLNKAGMSEEDRSPEVGAYCAERGFYIGQNGLAGNSYKTDSARRRAFAALDSKTKFFFEMVQKSGGQTGTLMEVMKAAERIHCSYLNVYPEDVLQGTKGNKDYNPEFEEALKYGASIIGKPVVIPAGTGTPPPGDE